MQFWFGRPLWQRVFLGLILGAGLGLTLFYTGKGDIAESWIYPFGQAFIALIKMLIMPLIFFSLTAGVVAMGDPSKLGSLGGRTVGLYLATTAVAVTLGLGIGTVLQPGKGIDPTLFETASQASIEQIQGKLDKAEQAGSFAERLLKIIPDNVLHSLTDNGAILPIIFFSILLGVGILVSGEEGKPMARWFESGSSVMQNLTLMVMETAPFGVFALITWVLATKGPGVLTNLGLLALALYLTCILHIIITYASIIKFGLGLPLKHFFRGILDAQSVAYSTASSSATLPVSITCATENLGIAKPIAASVLPLGATINMDGTAVYIGLIALFGAQALGVPLSLADYFAVGAMATLVSIGAAGIPSAGLLLASAALTQIGISEESAILIVAFIFPFDRLLDMMRTFTNVTGDLTVATAVANWENAFDKDVYLAEDI